jgi:8-oxo-dGTP diphosphatase
VKDTAPKQIKAAGAVLWRRTPGGGFEVALIHRPRYDDWSLPKGKVDSGETPIVAAVREVAEETGSAARLGRHLATVSYPVAGRVKQVDYWAAEAIDDRQPFVPNDEADQLMWLPAERAAGRLSYPIDRDVVAEFRRLPADTRTVLLVRHAKAGSRERYRGDDRLRPLDSEGVAQAAALVPNLLAFGAREVHAADPVRCVRTVTPLAQTLGVTVVLEPVLSESGYPADPEGAEDRVRKIAAHGDGQVICSQGKVIPGLLRALAERDGMTLPPAGSRDNRKGSFWVLSTHEGQFLAADYVPSALP